MKDKDVELTIQTSRGFKQFTFPRETKIADVTTAAAQAFGFSLSDTLRIVLASDPQQTLESQRTLVSYHVVDGTVLILTDVGSGV